MKKLAYRWALKAVEKARAVFPDYRLGISGDPDDDSVAYVYLFGVPDAEAPFSKQRARLWGIIEDLKIPRSVEIIPAIKGLSDTKTYYPNKLPH